MIKEFDNELSKFYPPKLNSKKHQTSADFAKEIKEIFLSHSDDDQTLSYLLQDEDENSVGFLVLYLHPYARDKDQHHLSIDMVFLKKEYRENGLINGIIDNVKNLTKTLNKTRKNKITFITIDSLTKNIPSMKAYHKNGFTDLSTHMYYEV